MIEIDKKRISVYTLDPDMGNEETVPFHCHRCGKRLFDMNGRFVIAGVGGVMPIGMYNELPLNIFRMVRFCGQCRHYHIFYLDGKSREL